MKLSAYLKHWFGVSIFVVAFLLTAACSKVSPTKGVSSPESNPVVKGLSKESTNQLLAEWDKLVDSQQAAKDELDTYRKLMNDKVKEAQFPEGTEIKFESKAELCKHVNGGVFCSEEAKVVPPVTPETPAPAPGTNVPPPGTGKASGKQ